MPTILNRLPFQLESHRHQKLVLVDPVEFVNCPKVVAAVLIWPERADIEAAISCFKRAYGAARCTWRGLDHFKAYIWSAVVAHNLVLFARLKPA